MPLDGDSPYILCASGRQVPLAVRRDPRARRFTLRLEPQDGSVTLVLPDRAALAEALHFAQRKAGWIERQIASLPPRVPFEPGTAIPVLGEQHVILHRPDARRGTWRETGEIHVSGFGDHLARRVTDFLKREARAEIARRVEDKAARVDRPVNGLSLRDTRSRWGSCSSDGRLNFSWRLILAPEPVLDYVVAHEIGHLVHMDHSARFWALVATLTEEVETPRRWLKRHGSGLHRYG